MELSILTSKCTLVPSHFFDRDSAAATLSEVVSLSESDTVKWIEVKPYDACLIYCDNDSTATTEIIENSNGSGGATPLPELYFILRDLPSCTEYNKILCTWSDSLLFIAIAQGKSLLLANVYPARDFVTAEYYIFLAMKSLQLNPEMSTVSWRRPISAENEMALYRYFKAVEQL